MHRLERYFLGNFVCKGENYQLILQAKFGFHNQGRLGAHQEIQSSRESLPAIAG
jgi:hypothetical protein